MPPVSLDPGAVLLLVPSTDGVDFVVNRPVAVDAPVVGPALATELDAGDEVVALGIITAPVVLALNDVDLVIVVLVFEFLATVVVLLALPPSTLTTALCAPSAALYAFFAAASALITTASEILYFVPSHAVCTAFSGAVKNSG